MKTKTYSHSYAVKKFNKILKLVEQGYKIITTKNQNSIVKINPIGQVLDLLELKRFLDSLLIKTLKVNAILLDRKEVRY